MNPAGPPTESAGPVVLIVDDAPENLGVLGQLLRSHGYRVRAANSGPAALRYAVQAPRPELLLLDVLMPDMDGYEVLRHLRAERATADLPVIFVTALDDTGDEERGLELGAADYITKPIRPAVVLARVRAQLEAKRARDWLRDQNNALEAEVGRRMAENERIQEASILALAHLAEIRDPETGHHIRRTQAYVRELALHLQSHPRFAAVLTDRYVQMLVRSAALHDIGKVGVPDHILHKPGKLDAEEWEIMKSHSRLGAESIERAERDLLRPLEFLKLAKEVARWHHERWDGSGYPDGLAGEAIPISARLMALADVFDAIISPRVYKQAMSYERARGIILEGRGVHFDPDVTDAFAALFERFIEIAEQHRAHGLPGTAA